MSNKLPSKIRDIKYLEGFKNFLNSISDLEKRLAITKEALAEGIGPQAEKNILRNQRFTYWFIFLVFLAIWLLYFVSEHQEDEINQLSKENELLINQLNSTSSDLFENLQVIWSSISWWWDPDQIQLTKADKISIMKAYGNDIVDWNKNYPETIDYTSNELLLSLAEQNSIRQLLDNKSDVYAIIAEAFGKTDVNELLNEWIEEDEGDEWQNNRINFYEILQEIEWWDVSSSGKKKRGKLMQSITDWPNLELWWWYEFLNKYLGWVVASKFIEKVWWFIYEQWLGRFQTYESLVQDVSKWLSSEDKKYIESMEKIVHWFFHLLILAALFWCVISLFKRNVKLRKGKLYITKKRKDEYMKWHKRTFLNYAKWLFPALPLAFLVRAYLHIDAPWAMAYRIGSPYGMWDNTQVELDKYSGETNADDVSEDWDQWDGTWWSWGESTQGRGVWEKNEWNHHRGWSWKKKWSGGWGSKKWKQSWWNWSLSKKPVDYSKVGLPKDDIRRKLIHSEKEIIAKHGTMRNFVETYYDVDPYSSDIADPALASMIRLLEVYKYSYVDENWELKFDWKTPNSKKDISDKLKDYYWDPHERYVDERHDVEEEEQSEWLQWSSTTFNELSRIMWVNDRDWILSKYESDTHVSWFYQNQSIPLIVRWFYLYHSRTYDNFYDPDKISDEDFHERRVNYLEKKYWYWVGTRVPVITLPSMRGE